FPFFRFLKSVRVQMPEPPPFAESLEKAHIAIGAFGNFNTPLAEILGYARNPPPPADEGQVLRYALDTIPVCSFTTVFPGFVRAGLRRPAGIECGIVMVFQRSRLSPVAVL